MPSHNHFTWFVLCLTFVAGAWCSEAAAQSQSGTRTNRSSSGSSTGSQRAIQRDADDEERVPSTRGKATLDGRPRPTGNGGAAAPLERPDAKAFRIPKVSPEMEEILQEWETKSSAVNRLEGTFNRITYDNVFEVEQHSGGKYCFQFPDKGSFHQTGTAPSDKARSKKIGTKGAPFALQAGPSERWVCNGKQIIKIDEKEKSFERIDIPKEDQGQNIRNAPLPFVFGMKANEAKQRYEFVLDKSKTNDQYIVVKVRPLLQHDLANYREADVMLDRATCLPTAIRLTDPAGTKTDVYLFDKSKMVVNRKSWVLMLAGDPLNPDLRNLKEKVQRESPDGGRVLPVASDSRLNASPRIGPQQMSPRLPAKGKQTAEVVDDEEEVIQQPRRPASKAPTIRPRVD